MSPTQKIADAMLQPVGTFVRDHKRGLFGFLKGMVGSSVFAASISMVWYVSAANAEMREQRKDIDAVTAIVDARADAVRKLEVVATRLDGTIREGDRFRDDVIKLLEKMDRRQERIEDKIDRVLAR